MNIKLIMLMEKLRTFVKRDEGASAIEYALIAGLIAVAIVVTATALGKDISDLFENISDTVKGAIAP